MAGHVGLLRQSDFDRLRRLEDLLVSPPDVLIHVQVVLFELVMDLQHRRAPLVLHFRVKLDKLVRAREHFAVTGQRHARTLPAAHLALVVGAEAGSVLRVLFRAHTGAGRRFDLEAAQEIALLVGAEVAEPGDDDVRPANAVARASRCSMKSLPIIPLELAIPESRSRRVVSSVPHPRTTARALISRSRPVALST